MSILTNSIQKNPGNINDSLHHIDNLVQSAWTSCPIALEGSYKDCKRWKHANTFGVCDNWVRSSSICQSSFYVPRDRVNMSNRASDVWRTATDCSLLWITETINSTTWWERRKPRHFSSPFQLVSMHTFQHIVQEGYTLKRYLRIRFEGIDRIENKRKSQSTVQHRTNTSI